jgi:hypothetical protein
VFGAIGSQRLGNAASGRQVGSGNVFRSGDSKGEEG